METAPTLPDFTLALKPDEFQLPVVDNSWHNEKQDKGQANGNRTWKFTKFIFLQWKEKANGEVKAEGSL